MTSAPRATLRERRTRGNRLLASGRRIAKLAGAVRVEEPVASTFSRLIMSPDFTSGRLFVKYGAGGKERLLRHEQLRRLAVVTADPGAPNSHLRAVPCPSIQDCGQRISTHTKALGRIREPQRLETRLVKGNFFQRRVEPESNAQSLRSRWRIG